jgi:hypothetical protein
LGRYRQSAVDKATQTSVESHESCDSVSPSLAGALVSSARSRSSASVLQAYRAVPFARRRRQRAGNGGRGEFRQPVRPRLRRGREGRTSWRRLVAVLFALGLGLGAVQVALSAAPAQAADLVSTPLITWNRQGGYTQGNIKSTQVAACSDAAGQHVVPHDSRPVREQRRL